MIKDEENRAKQMSIKLNKITTKDYNSDDNMIGNGKMSKNQVNMKSVIELLRIILSIKFPKYFYFLLILG